MSTNKNLTKKLTESAVLLALATVLSFVTLLKLPYGGSITLCSTAPIIILSYRHGTLWGVFSAFVFSLIQLLLGLSNLSYATSAAAAIAIIMLDYIVAFSLLGLGGIFKKTFNSQTNALVLGTVISCAFRYICHVISGCTVWAGVSIPDSQAIIYSLAYNATYMLPELLVTVIGITYLSQAVSFSAPTLSRKTSDNQNTKAFAFKTVGLTFGAAALIWDILLIAAKLQNPETGEFDITGILSVNLTALLVITLTGGVICAIFCLISSKLSKQKTA